MTRNRNTRNIRKLPLAEWKDKLANWASERGVSFRVTNGDHHWQFRLGEWTANWWPASCKLHIGDKCLTAKTADAVLDAITPEIPQPVTDDAPWDDGSDTVSRVESLEKRVATLEDALSCLSDTIKHEGST